MAFIIVDKLKKILLGRNVSTMRQPEVPVTKLFLQNTVEALLENEQVNEESIVAQFNQLIIGNTVLTAFFPNTAPPLTPPINYLTLAVVIATGACTIPQPYKPLSLEVYKNGQRMIRGLDYVETDPSTGVFTFLSALFSNDVVLCSFLAV